MNWAIYDPFQIMQQKTAVIFLMRTHCVGSFLGKRGLFNLRGDTFIFQFKELSLNNQYVNENQRIKIVKKL